MRWAPATPAGTRGPPHLLQLLVASAAVVVERRARLRSLSRARLQRLREVPARVPMGEQVACTQVRGART